MVQRRSACRHSGSSGAISLPPPKAGSCKGPAESLVPGVSGLKSFLGKGMENVYLLTTFIKQSTLKEGQAREVSFVVEDDLFNGAGVGLELSLED